MRVDNNDLLVDDLKLDPLKYKIHAHFREGTGLLPHQQSQWVLREFFTIRHFHLDRIYHDFFRLFSPDHIFTRRSVYEIREGQKNFLGAAFDLGATSGVQILSTRDVHILFDQGIVEALSILFFLNQSYLKLENFFIDMADRYKIMQFDSIVPDMSLTDVQYYSFLTIADQNNKTVSQFLATLAGLVSKDPKICPVFFKKRELTLLNIVISPDVNALFDFSECDDLKVSLLSRKKQLREILLASDRFSETLFQLTLADFQENLDNFLFCLKKYDENNFVRHRDAAIENYLQFFCDFFKIKFDLITSELQREINAVIFNEKHANVQRIYNVLMMKGALNHFYTMLDKLGLFSGGILNHFPIFLLLLRVFHVIVLYFEPSDSHKKQMTLLKTISELVVNSNAFVELYVSKIYRPVFDCLEISDDINVDEMVPYCQDWLGKTDLIGLNTGLINKNMLLLMFDRACWCLKETRRASHASCSIDFLQPIEKLREKVIHSKTIGELKEFVYQLMKLSDESFLTTFFRYLILHCNIELKLGLFIQRLMALKDSDEQMIHAKIQSLLLVSITNHQVKEFWNKLLFMYEAVAQEAGWCRIDTQPVLAVHLSTSQPSFFGSGNVRRVLVSSAENLLSTATAAAESDSAKVMVDSLKSFAGSASDSVVAAAVSAKAVIASASELVSAWWKR